MTPAPDYSRVSVGFVLGGIAVMADRSIAQIGPLQPPVVTWHFETDRYKYQIQVTRVPLTPEG